MNKKHILGTILSGGKSSRLGIDKGLMKFNEKPMISYSISVLNEVVDNICISTSDTQYESFGHPLVSDLVPNLGPIGGIYSVMNNFEYEYYFVIACDMPFASAGIASELIRNISSEDILVPVYKNMTEPLFGIYSGKVLSTIKEQISLKDYKLMNLLEKCNTKFLEVDSMLSEYSNHFKNINTPGDAKQQ